MEVFIIMKLVAPKPFLFEGGKRAVLLLHYFTGSSANLRKLGRFLQEKGYTCYAPQYKGNGVSPEEFIQTGPEDWWRDILKGYQLLKDKGHEEIAVAGISLGGVFSLKLGYTLPIKGIISMCAPMHLSAAVMYEVVLAYARDYKKREEKSAEQIKAEMDELKKAPINMLKELETLCEDVHNHLQMISAPTFVVQARLDQLINPESATIIYEGIQSDHKQIKWYEQSSHVITQDKEQDQLHEDVYNFLETLDWK